MINLTGKNIGIWGFGVSGKATLSYLLTQQCTILVSEQRALTQEEQELLNQHNVTFLPQEQLQQFLSTCDIIIPSPGIDLRPYKNVHHKFLAELDLFFNECKKPIIAITGTVGKTTITSLLSDILTKVGKKIITGGNIGVGMLGMLNLLDDVDYVILEVSSFQLELCKEFAPHLALWTNLSSNHLDRHGTMQNYFTAKYQVIAHQKKSDYAIVHAALAPAIQAYHPQSHLITFSASAHADYMINNNMIMHQATPYISIPDLPTYTYAENWLAITAALTTLGITPGQWVPHAVDLEIPHHRLEKIALNTPFDVYNDSKSTTNASTLAAVRQLAQRPIHLLIGGISKGADRTEMINNLPAAVVHAYCFGKEAEHLHELCKNAQVASSTHTTLEGAVLAALKNIKPTEQLLLSPGGASFDLFANYQDRGQQFVNIVTKLCSANH